MPDKSKHEISMVTEDLLRRKTIDYFKNLIASISKLPPERIEKEVALENYGIDSVMITRLTNELEQSFGSLSKTLFFEHQNIQALTEYFLESYPDQLFKVLGIKEQGEEAVTPKPIEEESSKINKAKAIPVTSFFNDLEETRFATIPLQSPEDEKIKKRIRPRRTKGPLDIAIIGLSGRYPQSDNLQEFWQNLKKGKDCITEISQERWDHSYYFDPEKGKPGKTYSKWGGFLNGVDEFDPLFFNISPRDAETMDPQERLFLQCVYETIEDAGYTPKNLTPNQNSRMGRNVGVFVGVMYEDYQLFGPQETILGNPLVLPGNPSSIANRVSWTFNFHGPCIALDTMCASSLTTIHLACKSLQQNESDVAIAGGVNITVHPNKYMALSRGKFLSSKGRCESFGENGDGYVPGEGVGAVLLKPLAEAVSEGDHIYGVIKGTAVNHGGKTNGYTVPNPNAQADVIGRALNEAEINPRTISYIEAHGTGTALGDPIEIAGLSKAFRKFTSDVQFCAIGSVKSNIGHCESAAGIGGVTKVLLQMKHKQLIPSLHSKVINPNLDFSKTPFMVQQTASKWERPIVEIKGEEREYPRIAGVSAFGAGGSNAHVVIEEYVERDQFGRLKAETRKVEKSGPYLIVLSAKSEDRLMAIIKNLHQFILHNPSISLEDLAYTLQMGREDMEERVGMIVNSQEDLKEKLEAFQKKTKQIENLYQGQVKPNKETLSLFAADEEFHDAIEKWIRRRKFTKLLSLWVKGFSVDWQLLYDRSRPHRISLPTYPFLKEKHWAPNPSVKPVGNGTIAVGSAIHPLLHQNRSDLFEQRFSSIFSGQEFFLSDHIVNGKSLLPGVAYLEMAREAVAQATRNTKAEDVAIQLNDIRWIRPIVFHEAVTPVGIALYPDQNGIISWDVYSEDSENEEEWTIHAQGSANLKKLTESPALDTERLRTECDQKTLSAEFCYEKFQTLGFDYGPSHQGIETIHVGTNQLLAKLTLPENLSGQSEQFALHPALMDSALQATIGFIEEEEAPKSAIPFGIGTVEVFARSRATMWAWIRKCEHENSDPQFKKVDIDLCDEQGNILIKIKEFTTKVVEQRISSTKKMKVLKDPRINHELLLEKTANYLREELAKILKLPANQIDTGALLEEYGVDSVVLMDLTGQLEKSFGPLSKTLFFEYQTIQELAQYFVESHQEDLMQRFGQEIEENSLEVIEAEEMETILPTEEQLQPLPTRKRTQTARFLSDSQTEAVTPANNQEIAIISLTGRYPAANTLEEFWENIRDGKDCISEIPKNRWDHSLYFDEDKEKPGKSYSKWGGFLDDIDRFDPLFFKISPRDAKVLDPNARLFMETTWNLFEEIGYTRASLKEQYKGKVGVYVGAMYQQYQAVNSDIVSESAVSLSAFSAIANRVSHFFDFHGPSMALDTMCSSALIAVHLASESLRKGECQLAVAGGVNLSLHYKKYLGLSVAQMIGSHADSRSFADGDGYIPCEGVGAVLLKPLSNAIQDQDNILAVIKSTATNHSGHTNGYSVPNPNAQVDLIDENLKKSGIDPRTISYVESAANGSALGDPIELTALNKAFGKYTKERNFCAIGSVKSNIGHAEAVSGMSQLSKVVLQLQNQQLAPTIKTETLNPNLSFEDSPFYLQQKLQEWKRPTLDLDGQEKEYPRRATVSCFGAGGSNAHLILEEYQSEPVKPCATTSELSTQAMLFSAGSSEQLEIVVRQMLRVIESTETLSLQNLAYTLQIGREAMDYRLAVLVKNRDELIERLNNWLNSIDAGIHSNCGQSVFVGNPEGDQEEIGLLLSGKTGETLIQSLLADKNLEKMALYWTKGGKIPWKSLYKKTEAQMLTLPTYPFRKERCWLESTTEERLPELPVQEPKQEAKTEEKQFVVNTKKTVMDNVRSYIAEFLSMELSLSVEQIKPNKDIQDYGVDSTTKMRLTRGFEKDFQVKISGREMLENKTINEISALLTQKINGTGIETLAGSEPFELSEGQKGLWALQKISPTMSAYNVPICLRFHQGVDEELLKKACQVLLQQHPILTATVEDREGTLYQKTQPLQPLNFRTEQINSLEEEAVVPYVKKAMKAPFSLETDPLLRVHCFHRSKEEVIVLITIHHFAFDGSSLAPFVMTLLDAYNDLLQGNRPTAKPTETSYKDFVEWEQTMLAGKEGAEHLAYWKQQLEGHLPILELPVDRPRLSTQNFEGNTLSVMLSPEQGKQIKQFAKEKAMNLSVLFLGIYKLLLHRYTGQEDILVGMPTMGRPEERFDSIVGYFINMIALRSKTVGTESFADLLRQLQLTLLDGLDHAAYPFPTLVRELNVPRTQSSSPVFQVAFAYQNYLKGGGFQMFDDRYQDTLSIDLVEEIHQEGEFELELEVYEQADGFQLNMKYNSYLFTQETIQQMMNHYQKLLEGVLTDPERPLGSYPILLEQEEKTLLHDWNQSAMNYPKEQSIHHFFEEQAQKTPDATALILGEKRLTYEELDEKSTQLAIWLQSQGVTANCKVGICVKRSFEMVIGILGILKSGGAYVPLDSEHPVERLEYMIEDSDLSILLTQFDLFYKMAPLLGEKGTTLMLDRSWNKVEEEAEDKELKRYDQPDNLAYIIYTSGSTGKPKGVMINHEHIVNTLCFLEANYPVGNDDAYLLKTNYLFDVSISELFCWFFGTGHLVILPPGEEKSPEAIAKAIEKHRISHINFVPSMLGVFVHETRKNKQFREKCPLKYVMVAGEAFPKELVKESVELFKNAYVENIYGPTEVSIYSSWYSCSGKSISSANTPIGKPITNTKLYVVDQNMTPVPVGVSGELCVSGVGVARGYLNREQLTAEKFIENPFEPGTKLYKTGDLVRWLPDGNIEYQGRIDHQVKIRGYRIELGEIEAALAKHTSIQKNAVLVREESAGNRRLIAYIVPEPQIEPDLLELKDFLKELLPDYMVPAAFVVMDRFPITSNGKLDRKALLAEKIDVQSNVDYVAPRNETEVKLADVWKKFLKKDQIGIHDNIFDIGGDSILAIQIAGQMSDEGIQLSASDIFKNPTIAQLSQLNGNFDKTKILHPLRQG